jgi:threonine dehydrogenase-like Zn-dependent dehydrogenase
VAHDGAFADSVLIPEVNLHRVPDQISDETAVFVEPVAAACRIPEQLPLSGNERVTVLGDGRLGNLCAQVLKHHGCQVRVVGKHDFKLKILVGLGIEALISSLTARVRRQAWRLLCALFDRVARLC